MKSHDHQKLFSPIQIGPITLFHRVVMAPLTRSRSLQPGDIPSDLMREYYTQRASDGGFILSEATSISITGQRLGQTFTTSRSRYRRNSWHHRGLPQSR